MRFLAFAILALYLVGCVNTHNLSYEDDSGILSDDLFAYKDITNTASISHIRFDANNSFEIGSDSVTKSAFVYMSLSQKIKFIVPILSKEMNVTKDYIARYVDARYISKQKKVFDYTSIIVWVTGTDYNALFYILIDKTGNPASYLRINGGFCPGVVKMADSSLQLCPIKNSVIDNDKIFSYVLTEYRYDDSVPKSSIYDSVSYSSRILTSGQIVTKKIDSVRFERIPGL